jgi:phage baseplate assembly protein W
MSTLMTDILVVPGFAAHDATALDLVRAVKPARARGSLGAGATEAIDVQTVEARENLAQALVLRLLTPRGSLAALGHAAYGSRLHELVGERKTDALRNLCRAFVLEAVAQEPRVEDKAVSLDFDLAAESGSTFVFTLGVQPRSGGEPIDLGLEVTV